MLVQACFAVSMASKAQNPNCDNFGSITLVIFIAVSIVVRVSHLIFIAAFFLCCFPCYFCNDNCCVKRWLVSGGGVSKQTMNEISSNWSWRYAAPNLSSAQASQPLDSNNLTFTPVVTVKKQHEKGVPDCAICFLEFERG